MEDQDRDLIGHIKGRLQHKQGRLLRDRKVLSDRDVLGKGVNSFWNEFRKAMGEICERLSRELGISLSCKWNGEELNVTRPNTRYVLNAKLGNSPPYEIVISGIGGLRYAATVRIVLDDSQLDWLAMVDENPAYARQVAGKAIEELVLAD